MELSSQVIYALLEKVRAKEPLWNPNHKDYKSRNLKRTLMDEISKELRREYPSYAHQLSTEYCMNRFQYLRSNFQKQLRKFRNAPVGPCGEGASKWEFFSACSFLLPIYEINSDTPSFEIQQNNMKPMSKKRKIDGDDSSSASTSKQDQALKSIPLMHKRPETASTPISTRCCSHDGQPGLTPKTKNKPTPESQHSKHQTLILKGLLEDVTFADVTLTAEGKSLKAHKAVLSAMSPYFKKVLQNNPSPHPIIIMPLDMQFEDLKGIIDYIYMGEIVVSTENLSSLFKAGRVLQVSGLTTVDAVGVKAPNAPFFDNDQSVHKDTSGATLSMETNQGSEVRNEDANKLQSSHGSRKSKGSSVENVAERQKHKDKGANSTIVTVEAAEPSENRNQKRPETVDSSKTESFEKTPAQPLQARGSCTVISDDDSSKCMFLTDEETMSCDFDYKYFEEQEEELDPLQIHSHGSDDSFHQSANISNGQQCDSINFVTVKEELED
ncbi:zinc finger and BTB domain-containing protein 14-like isoform X2 [Penaeus indicus]|uniref:zinc finger and BTB domain-containing protein 14-like isoform X2 n=1 Tax=Penaeus indicus TaxID=29960 RepID=UPI00300C6210